MDLQELKKIIKLSLKKQIFEAQRKRRLLPQNFTEFRSLIENDLIDQDLSVDFNEVYYLWSNLHEDTRGLCGRSAIQEWNESLDENVAMMTATDVVKDVILRSLKKKF